jgi:hypothetical protein
VPPIASADAPSLTFEVASVKAAAPADRRFGTLPVISRGRLEFRNVTLRAVETADGELTAGCNPNIRLGY